MSNQFSFFAQLLIFSFFLRANNKYLLLNTMFNTFPFLYCMSQNYLKKCLSVLCSSGHDFCCLRNLYLALLLTVFLNLYNRTINKTGQSLLYILICLSKIGKWTQSLPPSQWVLFCWFTCSCLCIVIIDILCDRSVLFMMNLKAKSLPNSPLRLISLIPNENTNSLTALQKSMHFFGI